MTSTTATTQPTDGGFIAYEYLTVRADRERASLYKDTFANFGWAVEGYGAAMPSTTSVAIKLKRDRRIKNRPLVQELQRKAEAALSTIGSLERSKAATATAASVSIGIVGCAFLAGSIFAIEADNWALSIPLGAVGLLGWLAGYLAHGRVKARRSAQVDPLIDDQFDIVYDTGEQAARLLG